MEYQRLFISLAIDQVLVKKLSRDLANLQLSSDKIKFVKAENFHLTMKFLGDTPIDRLDLIIQTLAETCQNFGPFELSLDKTQIFPENHPEQAPRVLSIGLKAEAQLQELYQKIEESLWQAGLANKEMKKFSPHLTLAKVHAGISRAELQSFLDWQPQGSFYVDHIDLQVSLLEKNGPHYSVLNSFDL